MYCKLVTYTYQFASCNLRRSLFHDTCLPLLRSITGIELTDTIDMTCSKYEYTGWFVKTGALVLQKLHTYVIVCLVYNSPRPLLQTLGRYRTYNEKWDLLHPQFSVISIIYLNTVDTDVLLCHDDELEGRRIAFIFYLVPEWTKEDGGELTKYYYR